MRARIVQRYVFREILVPFVFGLSIFTLVLLIARLLKLIEMVVSRGVPALNVARLFLYITPTFLEVTLPMAMLLAILIAFGRLSADSEMIALRSSGMSLYQLVPAVAIFVLITTMLTGVVSLYARPWGNRSMRSALYDIARTRASAGIKPQVFNDDFPGLVIYTEGVDATTDGLTHVLISDERGEEHNRIFAREAVMISDPEAQTVTLRLRDGFIETVDPDGRAEYRTQFQSYDVNLDLREALAGGRDREVDPKELSLGELRQVIADKRAAGQAIGPELVEYQRNFSIPFACIVFGLVAVPLGIQPVRAARARGFALSLGVIFVYYVLLSAGQALAEREVLPAVVGLWIPNVVFAVLGISLFRQAARERTIVPLERLQSAVGALRDRLIELLGAGAPA